MIWWSDGRSYYAGEHPPRRWLRHRLDVPLRVIIHTPDKTIIRDGRGCELGEGGMSFAAGVELKTGDQIEIEFTPAYSGRPIRVRAVARNGNGYSYGAEFVASSDQERQEIASLRENLQTLSSAYSPSYFPPSSQSAQASERRHDGPPRSPAEHAAALLNVNSGHTLKCGPLPAETPIPWASLVAAVRSLSSNHSKETRTYPAERQLGCLPAPLSCIRVLRVSAVLSIQTSLIGHPGRFKCGFSNSIPTLSLDSLKTANKVGPAVVIALTPRDSSEVLARARESRSLCPSMFTSLTMLGRRCRLNLCVGHLRSEVGGAGRGLRLGDVESLDEFPKLTSCYLEWSRTIVAIRSTIDAAISDASFGTVSTPYCIAPISPFDRTRNTNSPS